jgi:[methyl-Co(III) methanol-specific corrinoid protein]:coenzyme M methyltransferase
MTPMTRLIYALEGSKVDRPPFICPGGMMNMVTSEVMNRTGYSWEKVYENPEALADLALKTSSMIGIENIGVPFCMTAEAEAFGAEIEPGSLYTEPRIASYPLSGIRDWRRLEYSDFNQGRIQSVIKSIELLSNSNNNLPVIASITGPISLATSLIEPMVFFRCMYEAPAEIHAFLDFLTSNLIEYARSLSSSGAHILAIADPGASGEILGPRNFNNFALPYINRIIKDTAELFRSNLVHICGNLNSVFTQLNMLQTKAISIDSATGITAIRNAVPGKVIIGNVSTHLLERGTKEQVKKSSKQSLIHGAGILAPACGISMNTPLVNLKAMAETVLLCPEEIKLKIEDSEFA